MEVNVADKAAFYRRVGPRFTRTFAEQVEGGSELIARAQALAN